MPHSEHRLDGGARDGGLAHLRFLPEAYELEPERRWPLILFLHGANERGADLARVKRHGVPRVAEQRPDLPFIVLSPQCPAGDYWTRRLPSLERLLDDAVASLRVDPARVYLTGLSMGGYGAWHLAARDPQRFAALVPVCGGGLASGGFPERVGRLRDLPVWVFHGECDPIVPVSESLVLVEELRRYGGDVRLTLYPDCGHDSWTRTYSDPALYEWLLSHRART